MYNQVDKWFTCRMNTSYGLRVAVDGLTGGLQGTMQATAAASLSVLPDDSGYFSGVKQFVKSNLAKWRHHSHYATPRHTLIFVYTSSICTVFILIQCPNALCNQTAYFYIPTAAGTNGRRVRGGGGFWDCVRVWVASHTLPVGFSVMACTWTRGFVAELRRRQDRLAAKNAAANANQPPKQPQGDRQANELR